MLNDSFDAMWRPNARAHSFHQHGLTMLPTRINHHIYYKIWDEITYTFPNRSVGMGK